MAGRKRDRDMEILRRMRRERMMMRRGWDRGHSREMDMEMMMYERELMYRLHGEDFDMEFEEPKETEEEIKARDRQDLLYWISQQMPPSGVRYGNIHDIHDDLVRMVGRGWFKVIFQDTRRFEIFYLSNREFKTKEELLVKLCHFAMAAFNRREFENETIFILLVGVEENKDDKSYPLATGIPFAHTDNREEICADFKKLFKRGGTRRHGIKDSEVSTIDQGMMKMDILQCAQTASRNISPYPYVGVLSVHPAWVFCHEWCYMFGTVDANRRWHASVYNIQEGLARRTLDPVAIEEIELSLKDGYEKHRKSKNY